MEIKKDIELYIPQRAPMVMITEIVSVDERSIVTSLQIETGNIFCSGGYLREPGLIENIAQTAAARIGYICEKEKKKVPLGFIGAIKRLVIHQVPAAGETIITTVTIEHEVMNATIITGAVRCNSELLAECEMNIFLQEEGNTPENPEDR